jgi:hypothetical protein
MRASVLLPLCILVAACSSEGPQPEQTGQSGQFDADPLATPGALPPQVQDFPALSSRDCGEVAQFYFTALEEGEFDHAALVWDDPVIDGARLRTLFSGHQRPSVAADTPVEEGAAGSLYCTVTGTLSDAADPAKTAQEGELQLRRVNDVPGATPDQLRWTIRSSTFVEPMERSGA